MSLTADTFSGPVKLFRRTAGSPDRKADGFNHTAGSSNHTVDRSGSTAGSFSQMADPFNPAAGGSDRMAGPFSRANKSFNRTDNSSSRAGKSFSRAFSAKTTPKLEETAHFPLTRPSPPSPIGWERDGVRASTFNHQLIPTLN